ncbi:MAG: Na+/H+ antiporter NhaA, partial [Methylococcales bacterium]|nr:Na+/H+ antiporter NhaA [Methylococcales bacterium]
MSKDAMIDFFKQKSATGVLLVIAVIFAMMMTNTPLNRYYDDLLSIPVVVSFGSFAINKPLLLWINDGLMAVFFFMIGLEIKREAIEGSLSSPSTIAIPAFAALGGMVVPALIYVVFNWNSPDAPNGWAI